VGGRINEGPGFASARNHAWTKRCRSAATQEESRWDTDLAGTVTPISTPSKAPAEEAPLAWRQVTTSRRGRCAAIPDQATAMGLVDASGRVASVAHGPAVSGLSVRSMSKNRFEPVLEMTAKVSSWSMATPLGSGTLKVMAFRRPSATGTAFYLTMVKMETG